MVQSQEYLKREFMHFISDTLALLGAEAEIVHKVKDIEEKPFSLEVIDALRQYNITQHEKIKSIFTLLHTTSVHASSD